jgi:hypothetical protein
VSYPRETIYLALADITACFRFPRISADVTGTFGFIAEYLYFFSTSRVFGSNTSASSWEAFRRAIQNLIPVLSQKNDLIQKHNELLNMVKWHDKKDTILCRAHPCDINQGVLDDSGKVKPLEGNIYVDDILAAAAFKEHMISLLAATTEAIFLICGSPDITVQQCPLSLEKWFKLIVGPRQIVLGLLVDTDKMTVSLTA